MDTNRYAPPLAPVADDILVEPAPALWNPNAAANWSLLFTPAFGAWLHMRNWQALGDEAAAARSRIWLQASLGMLVLWLLAALLFAEQLPPALDRIAFFVLLISWYFGSARSQAGYVKRRFGDDYPRLSWGKPIGVAIGVFVGYLLVAFVLGFVMAAIRGH